MSHKGKRKLEPDELYTCLWCDHWETVDGFNGICKNLMELYQRRDNEGATRHEPSGCDPARAAAHAITCADDEACSAWEELDE